MNKTNVNKFLTAVIAVGFILSLYVLYSNNIASRSNNSNSDEQRIAELESQVESLNKKIREQNRTPSTETRSSEVTESSSESTANETDSDIRLPTIEDIDCEQFTEAEIVSVDYRKDQNFNGYLIVEVKNNYRRTIRSLRISTSGWIERYNGYYNEKVRAGTETEPVTIRPGTAEKIILNDNWGPVLKPMIVVDAVTFTDGSYDESSPGFDNSSAVCNE